MKTPKILDVIRSLIRVRREKGGITASITLGHEAASRYWEELIAYDAELKASIAIPEDIKRLTGMRDPETWASPGPMPTAELVGPSEETGLPYGPTVSPTVPLGHWCGVAIILDARIGARDMRAA